MSDLKPTFVLVHGAFVDSSGWAKVAKRLRDAGYEVRTPDNPGAAEGYAGPLGAVTFDQYVSNVKDVLAGVPKPVVLVGHSMAGMIVTQVAEDDPDALKAVVYLSAYLPAYGEALQALAGSDSDSRLGPQLKIDPRAGVGTLTPEAMAELFFHDVSDADRADGLAHQRAQPLAPFGTPVHRSDANFGRVPRYYIMTTQDRAVSPALQKRMIERTPVAKVFTIDGGHASFLSHDSEVAADLLEVART